MARVELDDTAGPAGELALQPGRGARVLGAHEVCRGDVVPGSRPNRLPGHLHVLNGEMIRRLGLDVGVAVLQECVHQQLGANLERPGVEVDVEGNGAGVPSPNCEPVGRSRSRLSR
jgi:hypothetical protein